MDLDALFERAPLLRTLDVHVMPPSLPAVVPRVLRLVLLRQWPTVAVLAAAVPNLVVVAVEQLHSVVSTANVNRVIKGEG